MCMIRRFYDKKQPRHYLYRGKRSVGVCLTGALCLEAAASKTIDWQVGQMFDSWGHPRGMIN